MVCKTTMHKRFLRRGDWYGWQCKSSDSCWRRYLAKIPD